MCSNTLRRVLSGLGSCGFGYTFNEPRSVRFKFREMDFCHCRLIRADAITVLKGKPYVHLRAANCPAAICISNGKECSEFGLEKT